jgi:hypothetical protein
MQAKTTAHAAETAALLAEFGIKLSAGGVVVMSDFAKAKNPYIHHSRVPVAVVAIALASPTFARGRFPKLRLIDVVMRAPAMDDAEKHALAAVSGVSIADVPRGASRAPAFAAHLVDVITRYELDAFFTRDPARSINGIDVRPRGLDPRSEAVDAAAMTDWRRAYKAATTIRRIMVANIIVLYRGEADRTWLVRMSKSWHAADAIAALQQAGALRDWGRLVALYPGW